MGKHPLPLYQLGRGGNCNLACRVSALSPCWNKHLSVFLQGKGRAAIFMHPGCLVVRLASHQSFIRGVKWISESQWQPPWVQAVLYGSVPRASVGHKEVFAPVAFPDGGRCHVLQGALMCHVSGPVPLLSYQVARAKQRRYFHIALNA